MGRKTGTGSFGQGMTLGVGRPSIANISKFQVRTSILLYHSTVTITTSVVSFPSPPQCQTLLCPPSTFETKFVRSALSWNSMMTVAYAFPVAVCALLPCLLYGADVFANSMRNRLLIYLDIPPLSLPCICLVSITTLYLGAFRSSYCPWHRCNTSPSDRRSWPGL
ncbi:hypothetical protein BC629DRAFT_1537573 [Irpex lacteus]|nr:hypothetical protein BC629DRAFT_1537573 [Irpex lacteus]